METEAELIRRWKKGEEEAFNTIYEKYKNRALRTAWLLCKNLADSEDIVQETFVQCYFHIQELKEEQQFRAWMLKILVRTGWKMVKKQKKEMPEEQIELHMQREKFLENTLFRKKTENPLEQTLAREFSGEVSEALEKLSEKHRIVIVLYYYEELSIREIAKVTGSLEGTVKSRLYFARKQLKKQLFFPLKKETRRVNYERG